MLNQYGYGPTNVGTAPLVLGSNGHQSRYDTFFQTTKSLTEGCATSAVPRHYASYSAEAHGQRNIQEAHLNRSCPVNPDLSIGECLVDYGSTLHLDPLNTISASDSIFPHFRLEQPQSQNSYTYPNHHCYLSASHTHYLRYEEKEVSSQTHATTHTVMSSVSDMEPTASGLEFGENRLSEDDSTSTTTSTSFRKRSRDYTLKQEVDTTLLIERPYKVSRPDKSSGRRRSSSGISSTAPFSDLNTAESHQDEMRNSASSTETMEEKLEKKQMKFIRQWYTTFARSESRLVLSNESTSALATLVQARPQLVFEYIKTTYPSITDTSQPYNSFQANTVFSQHQEEHRGLEKPYDFSTANAHLSPMTFSLAEKYVTACRRPRPRIDGRRSVNTGPYKCTFGCGYRTKRVFDWRRHEETHEPQELWLCTFCSQHNSENPFLVSRKDKFLRHAKECHKEWSPDEVLRLSKVDFVPRAVLGCPRCGLDSVNWDERCRHVLGHFEDGVKQGLKRPNASSTRRGKRKGSVEESLASGSVTSVESDEE